MFLDKIKIRFTIGLVKNKKILKKLFLTFLHLDDNFLTFVAVLSLKGAPFSVTPRGVWGKSPLFTVIYKMLDKTALSILIIVFSHTCLLVNIG